MSCSSQASAGKGISISPCERRYRNALVALMSHGDAVDEPEQDECRTGLLCELGSKRGRRLRLVEPAGPLNTGTSFINCPNESLRASHSLCVSNRTYINVSNTLNTLKNGPSLSADDKILGMVSNFRLNLFWYRPRRTKLWRRLITDKCIS